MKCPKCRDGLKARLIGSIQVDDCPICKGTWFDCDELRKVKDLTDPDLNWLDFELWSHKDRFHVNDAR